MTPAAWRNPEPNGAKILQAGGAGASIPDPTPLDAAFPGFRHAGVAVPHRARPLSFETDPERPSALGATSQAPANRTTTDARLANLPAWQVGSRVLALVGTQLRPCPREPSSKQLRVRRCAGRVQSCTLGKSSSLSSQSSRHPGTSQVNVSSGGRQQRTPRPNGRGD